MNAWINPYYPYYPQPSYPPYGWNYCPCCGRAWNTATTVTWGTTGTGAASSYSAGANQTEPKSTPEDVIARWIEAGNKEEGDTHGQGR